MKVFVLPPKEDWIVDRLVSEWNDWNPDITTTTVDECDVIWALAEWCIDVIPTKVLKSKPVVVTVHHITPEKFGQVERQRFASRDEIVTCYHVYNYRTYDFVRNLTAKPIFLVPYWANQSTWRRSMTKEESRYINDIPEEKFVVGSFQRDTEGHDLISPKLEKGPDRFVEIVDVLRKKIDRPFEVLLAGWRRQYVISKLEQRGISYTYIERPSLARLSELYQALDLYVVASRHEGGPQSLIECGLLDVPMLSTPVGIAEQVLPVSAISEDIASFDISNAAIPNVEHMKIPNGFLPYRELFQRVSTGNM